MVEHSLVPVDDSPVAATVRPSVPRLAHPTGAEVTLGQAVEPPRPAALLAATLGVVEPASPARARRASAPGGIVSIQGRGAAPGHDRPAAQRRE